MAFNFTSAPPSIEVYELEPYIEDILITPPITIQKNRVTPPPPPNITNIVDIEPAMDPIIEFTKKVEINKNVKAIVDVFANDPIPDAAPIVHLVKEEALDDSPLIMAERMPIYGSCEVDEEEEVRRDCTNQNLLKHIYENVKYPPLARESSVEGTVVVSFVVNKSGKIEDIKLVRDIGAGCGNEVERVIRRLGEFLPGKQNGRPVSVIYRIPVKFRLE
jgi:protein TonB